nr:hypothetical protein [uncultured Niameybacter sp.]
MAKQEMLNYKNIDEFVQYIENKLQRSQKRIRAMEKILSHIDMIEPNVAIVFAKDIDVLFYGQQKITASITEDYIQALRNTKCAKTYYNYLFRSMKNIPHKKAILCYMLQRNISIDILNIENALSFIDSLEIEQELRRILVKEKPKANIHDIELLSVEEVDTLVDKAPKICADYLFKIKDKDIFNRVYERLTTKQKITLPFSVHIKAYLQQQGDAFSKKKIEENMKSEFHLVYCDSINNKTEEEQTMLLESDSRYIYFIHKPTKDMIDIALNSNSPLLYLFYTNTSYDIQCAILKRCPEFIKYESPYKKQIFNDTIFTEKEHLWILAHDVDAYHLIEHATENMKLLNKLLKNPYIIEDIRNIDKEVLKIFISMRKDAINYLSNLTPKQVLYILINNKDAVKCVKKWDDIVVKWILINREDLLKDMGNLSKKQLYMCINHNPHLVRNLKNRNKISDEILCYALAKEPNLDQYITISDRTLYTLVKDKKIKQCEGYSEKLNARIRQMEKKVKDEHAVILSKETLGGVVPYVNYSMSESTKCPIHNTTCSRAKIEVIGYRDNKPFRKYSISGKYCKQCENAFITYKTYQKLRIYSIKYDVQINFKLLVSTYKSSVNRKSENLSKKQITTHINEKSSTSTSAKKITTEAYTKRRKKSELYEEGYNIHDSAYVREGVIRRACEKYGKIIILSNLMRNVNEYQNMERFKIAVPIWKRDIEFINRFLK